MHVGLFHPYIKSPVVFKNKQTNKEAVISCHHQLVYYCVSVSSSFSLEISSLIPGYWFLLIYQKTWPSVIHPFKYWSMICKLIKSNWHHTSSVKRWGYCFIESQNFHLHSHQSPQVHCNSPINFGKIWGSLINRSACKCIAIFALL